LGLDDAKTIISLGKKYWTDHQEFLEFMKIKGENNANN
jgi:hypothetical protein